MHRVQRIPPTETRGRRHTSTVAVSILPYKEFDPSYKDSEFRIEATKGSGPGGQHRNKTMTAIRITHIPTKLTAYADGRSQHCNKRDAMAILLSRLKRKDSQQFIDTTNQIRSNQIDDMSRGVMRVRTYNFISNVVIDERISKKFQPREILNGRLDLIYDVIQQ